jgi:hypothetical protein
MIELFGRARSRTESGSRAGAGPTFCIAVDGARRGIEVVHAPAGARAPPTRKLSRPGGRS